MLSTPQLNALTDAALMYRMLRNHALCLLSNFQLCALTDAALIAVCCTAYDRHQLP
jgi:hypothetical protein